MRPAGGLLLAAAAVLSASSAEAQSVALSPDASAAPGSPLFQAAFATPGPGPDLASAPVPARGVAAVGLRGPETADAGDAPFILPAYSGSNLDQARLIGPARIVDGGLAVWNTGEVTLGAGGGGVDSVRMSLGSLARAPGGVITARPGGFAGADAQAFDVRYIHGWPSALQWSAAGYALDVSPHAGLGVSNAGGTAEAGAMIRFGAGVGRNVARKLGLHEVDGSTFDDRGRWYLFAAASGQAVGLNISPGAPGMPKGSWSSETTSALISDAQAGVGWRKGDLQASFGYVHREIKGQSVEPNSAYGQAKISDSMLAFSLSIHPH
jgi:hypothetical protein